jgi:hypothetical protein
MIISGPHHTVVKAAMCFDMFLQRGGSPMRRITGRVGMTPRQFARIYAMSPTKVRNLILAGELGAIGTTDEIGRDRFVILPEHLDKFNESHTVVPEQHKAEADRRRATRG